MITKHYTQDFPSQARTLRVSSVSDDNVMGGTHTKTHPSGWTITGEVREDYYTWVNDFTATHPIHGAVSGDFEKTVTATSEAALADFLAHHAPEEWDYYDI